MTENGAPVSPAPQASALTPAALCEALRHLEPRPAAVLTRRLLEERPLDACAAFYGVSREAFALLLLRAAQSLTRALGLPARPPVSEDEERTWARMLTETLEGGTAPVAAALVSTVEVCQRLRATRAEVQAALDAAEREEENSPRRRRQDLLRRLAVAVLLALTAYLYWTRPAEPPARPVYPAKIRH
jgi:hypothetical protein